MIQAFYSAAVGAQQQMRSMDVHANNIANINTYGYKAQTPAFQALMYGMLDGADGSQLPKGSGSRLALTGSDFSGQDGYPIAVTDPAADLPVGVFNIQYQDGLERAGSERFLMNDKNGAVWTSGAKLQRGYLESSNADLATELTGVIEAQRSYSYALKMVTTADEVETTVNGLANV